MVTKIKNNDKLRNDCQKRQHKLNLSYNSNATTIDHH